MDIGLRVMKQVQVSTSLTLVRFLSTSLNDSMGPLDAIVLSALVLAVTYVVGREYVLSPLSRRLAVLLMLEKIRPVLAQHINEGMIFHVHGLMVNAGFLSLLAVIPPSVKQSAEGSVLVQSFIYMYSDIFGFLAEDESLHLTLLCVSFVGLAYLSTFGVDHSKMTNTMAQVGSMSFTYLVLQILHNKHDSLTETSLLYVLLTFTLLHFLHLPGLQDVEDYMVYNVAGTVQSYIKSDPWYWCGMLFVVMQVMKAWLTLKSLATQVLVLVIANLAVQTTLTYIKQLAIYDTIVTLKTSALVMQFVVNMAATKLAKRP